MCRVIQPFLGHLKVTIWFHSLYTTGNIRSRNLIQRTSKHMTLNLMGVTYNSSFIVPSFRKGWVFVGWIKYTPMHCRTMLDFFYLGPKSTAGKYLGLTYTCKGQDLLVITGRYTVLCTLWYLISSW